MIKKDNWNLKWNMLENEEKTTDKRFGGGQQVHKHFRWTFSARLDSFAFFMTVYGIMRTKYKKNN